MPQFLVVARRIRQALAAENFAMHPYDQDFFVIGSVEDANASALWQFSRSAPQEVMLQFGGARMLEARYLAALRINSGHHVLDGAVLAGRIHRLENEQYGVTIGRI